MKKLLCILLSVLMLMAVSGTALASSEEITVNATEIDLYFLEDNYASVLSVPEELNQSFLVTVTGTEDVWYEIINDESDPYTYIIEVDENGLVEPKQNEVYVLNTGEYEYYYTAGSCILRVFAGEKTFDITVNVKNYADTYVDEFIDDYIEKNLDDLMTPYEKMEEIAKFVSSYHYSASYSSGRSLFIMGEGDCWAFSGGFVMVAEKAGLDVWIRNANQDPGAGSGHINNMVCLPDGTYYEVECSFGDGDYYITLRNSLFSYRYYGEGEIEVYQYDGKEIPKKLEIPEIIDGKTVVSIGESFLTLDESLEEVVIPETVKNIGESAFNSCYKLKKAKLPSALESLGLFAFTDCDLLTELSSDSENFVVENNVIYNADKTTLIASPTVSGFTIPSSVTKIEEYAFYHNSHLDYVEIPENVKFIGEGAFGDCENLSRVEFAENGVEEIKSFAFANCNSLKKIEIPASVEKIGEYLFMNVNSISDIYCEAESKPDGWAEAWDEYCKSNVHWGYKPSSIVGDVDGNGKVEADDYIELKRIYFGMSNPDDLLNSAKSTVRCDVNSDGTINADDYMLLKRVYFGQAKLQFR